MVNLTYDRIILNDDISKHEIKSMPSLNLQSLTAFSYNGQYLRYKLPLNFTITFKYSFTIPKHIALLIMILLLKQHKTPLCLC
jgi:hypothetical protein